MLKACSTEKPACELGSASMLCSVCGPSLGGFSPGADDHAGDAQQLEPVPGHQPPPQVPVHALHGQVKAQA